MCNEIKDYIVYMHVSPSGKRYIGITHQNPPSKRWCNGKGYVNSEYFYRAICKYGWDNIKHEILYKNLTLDEARQKEIELIALYKSDNRAYGYNIEHGGNGVGRMADETKKKIANAQIGLKAVKVSRYSMSGTLIKIYDSVYSAADDMDITYNAISSCCRGKIKTVCGCIWRYTDEELTKEHIAWCNTDDRDNRKNAIKQYTSSGEFVAEYESAEYAQKQYGYDAVNIRRCCKKLQKLHRGFIWQYSDAEITDELIKWCNKSKTKGIKVVQLSKDNEYINMFNSINKAAQFSGVNYSQIKSCCHGEISSAGGYIWIYADDFELGGGVLCA